MQVSYFSTRVHQAGQGRAGQEQGQVRAEAGQGKSGQGRAEAEQGQGRVESDPGIIMYRGRDVQLSAILQCCSCDMCPVKYESSPVNSRNQHDNMNLCVSKMNSESYYLQNLSVWFCRVDLHACDLRLGEQTGNAEPNAYAL